MQNRRARPVGVICPGLGKVLLGSGGQWAVCGSGIGGLGWNLKVCCAFGGEAIWALRMGGSIEPGAKCAGSSFAGGLTRTCSHEEPPPQCLVRALSYMRIGWPRVSPPWRGALVILPRMAVGRALGGWQHDALQPLPPGPVSSPSGLCLQLCDLEAWDVRGRQCGRGWWWGPGLGRGPDPSPAAPRLGPCQVDLPPDCPSDPPLSPPAPQPTTGARSQSRGWHLACVEGQTVNILGLVG